MTLTQTPSAHWSRRRAWGTRDFENFRKNGMSAGLDGLSRVDSDGTAFDNVGAVNLENLGTSWANWKNVMPEWFFDHVVSIGTGNPRTIKAADGRELTLSDLMCLWNAWRLYCWHPDPPVCVVEIGGGFGCLAAQLMRMWPETEYHGVDLAQSLELQDYYLQDQHPNGRWSLHEDVPDVRPDLVINIRSMMEMTQAQVDYYISWIQAQVDHGGRFYCVNRLHKYTRLADYPFDEHWYAEINMPLLAQPHIRELLLRRQHKGGFEIVTVNSGANG